MLFSLCIFTRMWSDIKPKQKTGLCSSCCRQEGAGELSFSALDLFLKRCPTHTSHWNERSALFRGHWVSACGCAKGQGIYWLGILCCLLGIFLSLNSTHSAREERFSLNRCFILAQTSLQWLMTQWAEGQGEYLILMNWMSVPPQIHVWKS